MWHQAIIPIEIFQNKDEMYKFLDEFIKFCDKTLCKTFHFFIEHCEELNDCIYIRVEKDDNDVDEIKNWLCSKLPIENIKINNDYKDEIEDFGEEGWQIAKKLFEYTSRAAVYIMYNKPNNLFRHTKFVHCFLNQCGYNSFDEVKFHVKVAQGMLDKGLRELKIET